MRCLCTIRESCDVYDPPDHKHIVGYCENWPKAEYYLTTDKGRHL